MKHIRYKLLSNKIHSGFTDKSPILNIPKLKNILDLADIVWRNDKEKNMIFIILDLSYHHHQIGHSSLMSMMEMHALVKNFKIGNQQGKLFTSLPPATYFVSTSKDAIGWFSKTN